MSREKDGIVSLQPCASGGGVDFVVTWVNGNDSEWRAQKGEWLLKIDPDEATDWLTGDKRYRDWDLLRYWFRGVEQCAPWVRKVHFVTWGHIPDWLETSNEKLNIVKHEEFIPKKYLPTFNSHTIEFNLHNIDGLAEKFVYFNDDTYLLKPLRETDFFKRGLPRDFTGLDACAVNRTRTDYRPYNAMILNEHFNKNEVIKAHVGLWLNPSYGVKCLAKSLFLMPYNTFFGMQADHLPICFLKSSFCKIWDAAPDVLDDTCSHRFRGAVSVSPWLIRDWQRAEGNFVPQRRNLDAYLKCGSGKGCTDINRACRRIRKPVGMGMLCLNDECDSSEEFEVWGKALKTAFEQRFPKKSSFER